MMGGESRRSVREWKDEPLIEHRRTKHSGSNSRCIDAIRHLVIRAVNVLQDLRNAIFDTYRPELYYMRGPGPRWHAKHGGRVHRASYQGQF